jgi:hypothetical protein
MSPLRTLQNQYRGVNAHLHSYFQAMGGWQDFHTAHISDLGRTLKTLLLPMGYTAEIESSLQIRRVDDSPIRPASDVIIYDQNPERFYHPTTTPSAQAGEQVYPIEELLITSELSEKPYHAIAIYEQAHKGIPVAWLELLSPSNKGYSEDAEHYRERRLDILNTGVVFIEIDYLHETPSTFLRLPQYHVRQGQATDPNAHPYRIALIDPRPDFQTGTVHLFEFNVDDPLPTITIPLNGEDKLIFDFGVPYQKTFEEMLYGLEKVDYQTLPLHFERYAPTDQLRIMRRMLTVLSEDETTYQDISLEDGLAEIQRRQS